MQGQKTTQPLQKEPGCTIFNYKSGVGSYRFPFHKTLQRNEKFYCYYYPRSGFNHF